MAEHSYVLKEAGVYMRELTSDEELKLRLEAREKYYADRKAIYWSGFETGFHSGLESALKKINLLTNRLITDNRLEDLKHSMSDPEFLQQLFREYNISTDSDRK